MCRSFMVGMWPDGKFAHFILFLIACQKIQVHVCFVKCSAVLFWWCELCLLNYREKFFRNVSLSLLNSRDLDKAYFLPLKHALDYVIICFQKNWSSSTRWKSRYRYRYWMLKNHCIQLHQCIWLNRGYWITLCHIDSPCNNVMPMRTQ